MSMTEKPERSRVRGSRVTGLRPWVAVENRVIRLGFTEKVTLEHRLQRGGVSQGDTQGKSFRQKEQLIVTAAVLRAWSPPRSQTLTLSGNLLKTHIFRPHQKVWCGPAIHLPGDSDAP